MRITLEAVPALGSLLELDAQSYRLEAAEPYHRKDGSASALLTWQSMCPDCGDPFTVKTGLSFNTPNRRCSDCCRPRDRVRQAKRRTRLDISLNGKTLNR